LDATALTAAHTHRPWLCSHRAGVEHQESHDDKGDDHDDDKQDEIHS
jgi:hypothetical protein